MGEMHTRLARRRAAKTQLSEIMRNPANVVVIHYSCESFYERPDGSSPRITSIAVRNLASGQTTSFSIHHIAERNKALNAEDIEANYDEFEKYMLDQFYDYVAKHKEHTWLHWNMRDVNYGFQALAHRYTVLGGTPTDIHESRLCDLSRLLVGLYGIAYIGHPRLAHLVEKNRVSDRDFLTGKAEAEAFEKREYVKLHQSTLRKVDILANIAERAANGTLKTDARLSEIYGGYFAFVVETIRDHWLFVLLGIIGAILSVVGSIVALIRH
jgi:hypothetical protein